MKVKTHLKAGSGSSSGIDDRIFCEKYYNRGYNEGFKDGKGCCHAGTC
jgi:hypothetical protein